METHNDWKFCEHTTTQNKLAIKFKNCLNNIQSHILKEGCKNKLFDKEQCLNLDEIEICLAKKERRSKNSTVDAVIGLKKSSLRNILLCDFKFNVKNPRNIDKNDIDSKIYYSKQLFENSEQFHNKIYLIFKKEIKNEARSRIRRLYLNKSFVLAIDIEEFKEWHFEI